MMLRILKAFWRPSQHKMGSLIILGVLIGAGGLGAFNGFMAFSNSETFCLSCHDMQPLYDEYKHSVHASNPSGVVATCADCHVPKPWFAKLKRKIQASTEVYHHFLGTISTKEKLEEKRMELAQRVWTSMKSNNSRECRNCHSFEGMQLSGQREKSAKAHQRGQTNGETCIDCHKGIAHQKPNIKEKLANSKEALMAAAVEPVAGSQRVLLGTMKLYANAEGGKAAAVSIVGAPLKVEELGEGRTRVTIEGWRKNGQGRVLWAAPGREQLVASTTRRGARLIEAIDEGKEVNGVTWRKARITAWGAKQKMVASREPIWRYADELNELVCGQCHMAYPPQKYKVTEWPEQLKAMKPMAKLGKEDERLLQVWLQGHAAL
uniref:Cytochrome c-type protein n=1 Tax=Magnetococcus massalia (strain MO-1) TaxID=451514 RepID=A0A1S7LE63_MAGMO|nr:putative Cytochrome c-type protein torC [Candidatus Magnetococcus massalia]